MIAALRCRDPVSVVLVGEEPELSAFNVVYEDTAGHTSLVGRRQAASSRWKLVADEKPIRHPHNMALRRPLGQHAVPAERHV